MSDNVLIDISLDNLERLEEIYKVDWPKHIVIHSSLRTFTKQFQIFPELKQRMKLFVFSEDWKSDGAFLATVSLTPKTSLHELNKISYFSMCAMI